MIVNERTIFRSLLYPLTLRYIFSTRNFLNSVYFRIILSFLPRKLLTEKLTPRILNEKPRYLSFLCNQNKIFIKLPFITKKFNELQKIFIYLIFSFYISLYNLYTEFLNSEQ